MTKRKKTPPAERGKRTVLARMTRGLGRCDELVVAINAGGKLDVRLWTWRRVDKGIVRPVTAKGVVVPLVDNPLVCTDAEHAACRALRRWQARQCANGQQKPRQKTERSKTLNDEQPPISPPR